MNTHGKDNGHGGDGPGRRRFLTSAALGGATIVGASALGGLDADAAFAARAPPSTRPSAPRPSWRAGSRPSAAACCTWPAPTGTARGYG
ncbi:hypothetical protein NKH77_54490 [Streptomyces sp. M19]